MKRILRVHLDELLLGVFAPALGRYVHHRPFEYLQQRLLHAFARDVARDGGIVALARDLVDLVDENDAPLGLCHVVVGNLKQPRKDALDILAHIASLGQHGGVDDRERHLEQPGDRARHERLARTGGPHEDDVRLVELDVVVLGGVKQPFVVVVDRHRHITLGVVLPDDILVEELLDLRRLEQLLHLERCRSGTPLLRGHVVLNDDLIAVLDTFVADIGAVHALEHDLHIPALGTAERAAVAARSAPMVIVVLILRHHFPRFESTSSISPYSFASRAESQ